MTMTTVKLNQILLSKSTLAPSTNEVTQTLRIFCLDFAPAPLLTGSDSGHLTPPASAAVTPSARPDAERLSTPTLACAPQLPLLCVCVNHYLRCLQHNGTS